MSSLIQKGGLCPAVASITGWGDDGNNDDVDVDDMHYTILYYNCSFITFGFSLNNRPGNPITNRMVARAM